MDRVREILRLSELGLSQRELHRVTGVARSCIQRYLGEARVSGVNYEEAKGLSDTELCATLKRQIPGRKRGGQEPDYSQVHSELVSRKGVTLELLWMEWVEETGGGYSYSTFCRRHGEWCRASNVILRNEYRGGELVLCDYAGEGLSYVDASGVRKAVEIFVSVLGASNYTFAEATPSQKLLHWTNSNIRMLNFFGGVPEAVVIDNLKSGVVSSSRYEPELTRTYEEFGQHYGVAILPARPRKPRDKAKAEKAVQEVERWVLAPLRHHDFRSLDEINVAIRCQLAALNARQMRIYRASRQELFERLDKPALKPLPIAPFVAATWKYAKVSLDYHLQIENHYYSVPFHLARKSVWIKSSEKLVEVFHNNERVASHRRSHEPYRHSTIAAHMPPNHLAVKSRTPENFIKWSQSIGPQAKEFVQTLLDSPQHRELSYRSILGLQRLEKKFSHQALEQACGVALERRMFSQRFVKTVLEQGAFGVETTKLEINTHANIRGATYYH